MFISYSYSNGEIKPLKIIKFNTNKYKFENLEKIKIPENFHTHTLNLREKCKTSDYPKNIISYQGARHIKYYTEFIKKYYNLKSDQYYQSSKEYFFSQNYSFFSETDSDFLIILPF